MKASLKIKSGFYFLYSRLLKKRIPLIIGFSITYKCNYTCAYCFRRRLSGKELTTAEIMYIIDEFSKNNVLKVSLSGGEPLLREDFGKISHRLFKHNINHNTFTNGSLVNQRIDELKHLDVVVISLDGDKKTNDSLRGKGSFDKAIEAIQTLKTHNINVFISCVLTKKNATIENIKFLLNLCKKYNIKVNFQSYYHFPGFEKEDFEADSLKEALNFLKREKRKNRFINNSFISLDILKNPNFFIPKNCVAGKIYARIEPDGTLLACSKASLKNGINILDNGLKYAFDNITLPLSCQGCKCFGALELNSVYHLKPSAILNAFRSF